LESRSQIWVGATVWLASDLFVIVARTTPKMLVPGGSGASMFFVHSTPSTLTATSSRTSFSPSGATV
jgi:hypothetical protein